MSKEIGSVFFFPNGNVAVCDTKGQQWSKFQAGTSEQMWPLIREQLAKQTTKAEINGQIPRSGYAEPIDDKRERA